MNLYNYDKHNTSLPLITNDYEFNINNNIYYYINDTLITL